ncbi:hypothetical protein IFM89_019364 [Coptis chinensis]|uniref:Uncharacterized protein n=1 Tax=Coptis chinensis TaxID=261450 RepID=A0A835MA99_9MAGN|nr:hypothetical protein IFM89_019364 [Coptis chinensis]
MAEEELDPFSLVADELSILAGRLRAMVVAEVPKLASAAEYFFKMGVEGKRFRPTVLLLMASALNLPIPKSPPDGLHDSSPDELRTRQQSIAEITEMIHVRGHLLVSHHQPIVSGHPQWCCFGKEVASLLHDDVLDDADTRRGIGSLNYVMGNKSIEAGGSSSHISVLQDEEKNGMEEDKVEETYSSSESSDFNNLDDEDREEDDHVQFSWSEDDFGMEDEVEEGWRPSGIPLRNVSFGFRLAVLAGDFLLSRACVALASLKNTEASWILIIVHLQVVSLLAKVVEHLVTGETMQMTTTSEQRCSMEYYMQKTYYKTASLISNSCKAIAILTGQTAEVSILAYEYGRNLGLAFQLIDDVLDFTGTSASLGKGSLSDIRHGIITAPILFAMEEFPQLRTVVDRGFENPADVDIALDYLGKSNGIRRTRQLATEHAKIAAEAIDSLPESDDEDVLRSRRALVDLTHRVITRTK